MPLRLYFDHNVSAAVARGLRRRGIDVLTAHDDGSHELEDPDLLDRASSLGRVLFTHDDDLLRVAHQWQLEGRPFAGVIYVHQTQMGIGLQVLELERIAADRSMDAFENQVRYLPLR